MRWTSPASSVCIVIRGREGMTEVISPLELAEEAIEEMDGAGGQTPPVDLDAVRSLVLQAHPDIVPELVTGGSVDELLASVEPARSAYARLAEGWTERREATIAATVPAGGGSQIAVDPDRLPAGEKIRRGLAAIIAQKG